MQRERLTWKAPDERLLPVEGIDAARFLVELTDAVLAVEDAYELNDSFQKLTAGTTGRTASTQGNR
jgi:hypothetical protein